MLLRKLGDRKAAPGVRQAVSQPRLPVFGIGLASQPMGGPKGRRAEAATAQAEPAACRTAKAWHAAGI